jgi:hypothetical protein
MFIGHFAVSLAAKHVEPRVSLGALFLSAQLADLVWPNLVLAGLERVEIDPGNTAFTPLAFVSYPYSHSLTAAVLGAAAAALIYARWTRRATRSAVVIGLVVASHWLLDLVTHRPDLPLTFTGPARVGLGLWNSVAATLVVESAMFLAGLWLYLGRTRARDRAGSVGLWSLVAFLGVIYVANAAGPPPPSATAVAGAAQALWLLVAWAFWVDRHRDVRPAIGVR